MPSSCVGDAMRRLLFRALWPLLVMAAVQLVLIVGAAGYVLNGGVLAETSTGIGASSLAESSTNTKAARMQSALKRAVGTGVSFAILLSYCVLPGVARAIFETWCVPRCASCTLLQHQDVYSTSIRLPYLPNRTRLIW